LIMEKPVKYFFGLLKFLGVSSYQYNLKKISMFPSIYSAVLRKDYPDDWEVCPDTKEVLLKHGLTKKEWKACCEYEAAKHLSPHSTEIMMQRFKVMPDGRWMPLEPEKVRIKTNSPADQLKHSGKE